MKFNQPTTRNVQKGVREEEKEEEELVRGAKVRAKGRQQEYER
jgi:hypothetical protein